MSKNTLYDRVWDSHRVTKLPSGQDQLLIGLHLIHEVTTPQAFAGLREKGLTVAFPDRTFATMDHIIPTDTAARPYKDSQAESMAQALEHNVAEYNIPFFGPSSHKQGIVHVVGPELGLTQPGMTIACGDSHTSTHGAFGSLAFGIGTTEVQNVLETQSLALSRLKVRRIEFNGALPKGTYAKDVILKIIQALGVKGGIGYAYEFGGTTFDAMSMEERMTVCNMSIEGGARIGYVNPDQTTYDYIKGRQYAPSETEWENAVAYWNSIRSGEDAEYDDIVRFEASELEPMVTWGITPGQSVGISETIPTLTEVTDADRKTTEEAYAYMKMTPGHPIQGTAVDVVFIGSCTNSRISDLREAAQVLNGKTVKNTVTAIVVPGSQQVKAQAESEGLHHIFEAAGAQWRNAGCSMCLAM
ncbi:3-isopropylmalate dehydratase large subunit, partial [bacterium]|nr:3-isopropylmalate dehydratase large subunit [bacterium]